MDWFWKGRKDIEVEGVEAVEGVEEGSERLREVEGVEVVEAVEVIVLSSSSSIPFPTMIRCVLEYC